jgi:hypothetical protein
MARHPAIDAEAAGVARDIRQCGVDRRQHRAVFSGWVTPNLLGEAAVAMQAIAVGVITELQVVGLRRSGDALTA